MCILIKETLPRRGLWEREGVMWLGVLFLAHEYVDGGAVEVPFFSDFVLEVAAVGLFDPLRQVAEENEGGYLGSLEHGDIFDFDEFAFVAWGRIGRDDFLHVGVELGCGYCATPSLIYLDGGLEDLEDTLFGQCRGKDDGQNAVVWHFQSG